MYQICLVALKQYHGGTNFGRTTGGPFIATSYDYDAPIDEYGMPYISTMISLLLPYLYLWNVFMLIACSYSL